MAIAKDFERRGEHRANGQAWACRYGTAPEEGRQMMVRTFQRAYDYAKVQLKETGTVGGVMLGDFLAVKMLYNGGKTPGHAQNLCMIPYPPTIFDPKDVNAIAPSQINRNPTPFA